MATNLYEEYNELSGEVTELFAAAMANSIGSEKDTKTLMVYAQVMSLINRSLELSGKIVKKMENMDEKLDEIKSTCKRDLTTTELLDCKLERIEKKLEKNQEK